MKEEYLEIEELEDLNTQHDEQNQFQQQTLPSTSHQTEFLATQPADFDSLYDDAMLRKLLKKFQMCFLYPFLKACDITYRSLRFLSVDDINTAIRSVGQRAEFREKLFSWRRKRYRTNDVIIEHEKVVNSNGPTTETTTTTTTTSSTVSLPITNIIAVKPSGHTNSTSTETGLIAPSTSTSSPTAKTSIQPSTKDIKSVLKRDLDHLDTTIQEISSELDADNKQKRPKLVQTTVELRESRLNVQMNLADLLDECLFGPVMKAFYEKNGYLERKHRDELIQCVVDYVIKRDIKLHCFDFNKIVDMIVSIFPKEEESRDYYFINRKGKRNPMGRLYTKYYNTLKRVRVRDIHQEYTLDSTLTQGVTLQDDVTSAATTTAEMRTLMSIQNATSTSPIALAKNEKTNTNNNSSNSKSNIIILNNVDGSSSNNSNSINTQIELVEDEFQEHKQLDDTSVSAIKNFLRCQGLDWHDIKTMWAKTYLARQEDVEHSTIKDVLQQWPKYLNARGMELFDIDFRLKFSRNKANALHENWHKFATKIFTYYQGNIKDDMCKGLFALCKSKPGKDTEDYILTVLLTAIMLPTARYRDALGNRRKISIVEAVDLFVIRVNALEELEQKREEFSLKYGDIHNDYTPLIVVVGDANINIHEIYVHFDVALYEMPDFISALDCCMKIYRVLNLPYPSSNEYSWTFIQRYFYEIVLADDMKCPSMSSLITYLKL